MPLVEAVEIYQVKPDTAAERARIHKGDLIVSYNGVAVSGVAGLTQAVTDRASAADEVSVVVMRESRLLSFQIPTGKMGIQIRTKFVPVTLLQSNPALQQPALGEGH